MPQTTVLEILASRAISFATFMYQLNQHDACLARPLKKKKKKKLDWSIPKADFKHHETKVTEKAISGEPDEPNCSFLKPWQTATETS